MAHNSRSSVTLPKELEKILKKENRFSISEIIFDVSNPFTKEPTSRVCKSKKLMSYDTKYHLYLESWRTYIPMVNCTYKLPVIFYFHGGSFVRYSSSTSKYDNLCQRLALEIPCIVVSINYPLAPKYKCPEQYNVAIESVLQLDKTWFTSQHVDLKKEKTDASNLFLAGDEAGGNIAHNVATYFASHEKLLKNFKIKGLISIQPLFGGEERTSSEIMLSKSPMLTLEIRDRLWKFFLPMGYNRNSKEVNVSGPSNLNVYLKGFPKTLVIVGGLDPLQDWQTRYYNWLRQCGADAKLTKYPKAIPQFYLYKEIPESTVMMNEISWFVSTVMNRWPLN